MQVIPRLRGRVLMPVASALMAIALAAQPVVAWTQLDNDYPFAPLSCDNSPGFPCVEWAKTASNLSINVDVYLSGTLAGSIDLRTDVRNAMSEYNGIAARNPHLQETTTTTNDEIYVERASLPVGWYGRSSLQWNGTTTKLIRCDMVFGSAINWNRSLDFGTTVVNGETIYKADARKVANHEMGHCEALGHTGVSSNAVMKQGALSYYHVQANDESGIIAIYGAYP